MRSTLQFNAPLILLVRLKNFCRYIILIILYIVFMEVPKHIKDQLARLKKERVNKEQSDRANKLEIIKANLPILYGCASAALTAHVRDNTQARRP